MQYRKAVETEEGNLRGVEGEGNLPAGGDTFKDKRKKKMEALDLTKPVVCLLRQCRTFDELWWILTHRVIIAVLDSMNA